MLEYEPHIRGFVFLAVLFLVGLWEIIFPRRPLVSSKTVRWVNNLSLVFLNSIILRAVFPIMAVGLAVLAEEKDWGLGNAFDLPRLPWLVFSIILLDFLIYLQHVIFHKLGLLWRLHRMHHIDPDLDVTSGSRFHPVEIALSMLIKMGIVILFGIPALAVFLFEVILNASAMFNHGNIYVPFGLDRVARLIIVTPDMHRVHHSALREETDSNFGFFLSWWDRLFGTYQAQPKLGHDKMTIGVGLFLDSKYLKLNWLLAVPFLKPDESPYQK
ncbi:sterol desaturase family protein [bacterium]|nr:sterol desaturase family protein [bacterium]